MLDIALVKNNTGTRLIQNAPMRPIDQGQNDQTAYVFSLESKEPRLRYA